MAPSGAEAVTPGKLGLSKEERQALREAGLDAVDLAYMSPVDVVIATAEDIDEARARELTGVASLLTTGVIPSTIARSLLLLGVRDRDDLATRSPDDLFAAVVDQSALDSPFVYDWLSMAVYAASRAPREPALRATRTWTARRVAEGRDPSLIWWRHRYGRRARLPAPTGTSLRIPALRLRAKLVDSDLDDDGIPMVPLLPREVAGCAAKTGVLVGHYSWAGRAGAFRNLEKLKPGDEVLVGAGRDQRRYAVDSVHAGAAPLVDLNDLDLSTGITLMTRPHHRPDRPARWQVAVSASAAAGPAGDGASRPQTRSRTSQGGGARTR